MSLGRFEGVNAGYVLELYERFRQNPESVDPATRAAFEGWNPAELERGATQTASEPTSANVHAFSGRRGNHSRGFDPPLRASRRATRSAWIDAARRSIAIHCELRNHRRRSEAVAGIARRRPRRRDIVHGVRGDREAPSRVLLVHRFRLLAHFRTRGTRLAATCRRVRPLSAAARSREHRGAPRSHHAGRGVRAIPAANLPRQDAFLRRGARHAAARPRRDHLGRGRHGSTSRGDRHGAPRSPERARPHPREAVRADPRRVQGSGARRAASRGPRMDGRREVSRRRPHGEPARAHVRHDAPESESPGSGESGRRGNGSCGRHLRRPGGRRRASAARQPCRC